MNFFNAVFVLVLFCNFVASERNLKCLVCEHVVREILTVIENEDPKKKIQVGSFRIQPDGSQKQNEVKYAGSEIHLHEILETVCDSLDDYAQAKNKETGQLALLNLAKDVQKLGSHELVQDPDLNRGLKYYCEGLIEDFEDEIIAEFGHSKSRTRDPTKYLCESVSEHCEPNGSEGHQEL